MDERPVAQVRVRKQKSSGVCVRAGDENRGHAANKEHAFDILPAMNGRNSYGVPAGFAGISSVGSSHNRLTSAEDYEEALLSGYPPVGLLDAKNVYHAEQKGNRLPRPERQGLRSR